MSQKLPVNSFGQVIKTTHFNEGFIESYNDESNERYFFEVDAQYPKKLHEIHNDLPFLQKRAKIHKVEKRVAILHDKKEYVIHIIDIKQALNQGVVFKKDHGLVKFNKKGWLTLNSISIKLRL